MKILFLSFAIIGYLVRCISVFTLKNNFSFRVVPPTKINKTGIFKYARHPMYSGGLLMFGGLLLLSGHYLISIVIMTILFQFTLDRIDREECMLLAVYGQDYVDYMKKTKMLVPFIF